MLRFQANENIREKQPGTALSLRASIVFWLTTFVVSAHFTLLYLEKEKPFLYSDRFAYGHERAPYQYRFFMALMMRWLEPWMAKVPLPKSLPPATSLTDPWMLVVGIFVFLAIFFGTFATRISLQKLTADATYSCVAAFLFPLMAYFNFILQFGENYLLPYDIPSLGFFAIGLAAIVENKRWIFYPVFALACFNRETACFLGLLFVIAYWHRGERRLLLAAEWLIQTAIWASIYVGIRHHLPGLTYESNTAHLAKNLSFLIHPWQWPALAANFAFLWIIWLLNWKIIEPKWFRVAGIIVPLWLIVMLWLGNLVEIRIFGELIAYLSVAVGLVIRRGYVKEV